MRFDEPSEESGVEGEDETGEAEEREKEREEEGEDECAGERRRRGRGELVRSREIYYNNEDNISELEKRRESEGPKCQKEDQRKILSPRDQSGKETNEMTKSRFS